jgi:hypothetical protein
MFRLDKSKVLPLGAPFHNGAENITNKNIAVKNKIITSPIKSHFLVAEKIMSLLEYTQSEQETQAEPADEISGICLLFSGHLAAGRPIISFTSA